MVKRDRSHPSLVIYNLINEAWDSGGASRDPAVLDGHVRDLRDAHALDPSRTIVHTSAWALKPDDDELPKIHMRPFDNTVYRHGWFDNHHAGGPEVWRQNLYQSPDKYYNRTTNRGEIVYWGEEGAISTPPRLALIKASVEAQPRPGWDGAVYLDWYRQFDSFLTRKNLRGAFPTVDALTTAMGAVSLYHQGRKIEIMRLNNVTDGYAVNGWESETIENHSGIVDCWGNPQADPAIMAYYNQPFYVAVKTRSQFAQIPGDVTVDFYVINEKNLHGSHTLKISAHNPSGDEVFTKQVPVMLSGGETYGELLASNISVPIANATGMFRIEASLQDANGNPAATGHDEVLAVDWKSQKLSGNGATWESTPMVRDFLKTEKGLPAEAYRDDLGKLDWVVVTRPPGEGQPVEIPADRYAGNSWKSLPPTVPSKIKSMSAPTKPWIILCRTAPRPTSIPACWKIMACVGKAISHRPSSGDYTFEIASSDGVSLWVNGKQLFDHFREKGSQINQGKIHLEAGQPVSLRVELWHYKGDAQCKLLWAVPEADAPDPNRLIERVRNDGTTLFILDRADTWMNLITNHTSATYNGSFKIGTAWLGGIHFVREHPLFKDLPVNQALDWPYQAVVRNGKTRSGLLLEGEDLVAGAWHSYPMALGTAVGIIPCGKGKIVVSTLDIASQLNSTDTSAEVARKLLCNFILWAHP